MSVEHMARLLAQGITGRPAIRAVTFVALAVATAGGAGRAVAQTAAGSTATAQPPPFAPPDQKFPGNPPAEDLPHAPIEGTPAGNPDPPKWPGTPWKQAAAGAPPPAPSPSQASPPPSPPPPSPSSPAPPSYPPAVGGPAPSVSASPPPPSAPPPPDAAAADPQGDRVVLLPTATTHPAGTFYFSNYELVILQAGYAFTDDTQISFTAIPAPSESLTILDVSLKTLVYRGGLVRAAAIGSVSGAAGKDVGLQLLGRAGGVVQVCTSRRCDSSLSLSSNVMLAGALLIMVNGAGGIWRMSEHVSVLAELATMVPVGTAGGQFNGALLGGGIRLHYTHWGFDFAAMHILDSTADVSTVPFFAVTWLP